MNGTIEKTCGHCGQRFECGQHGCWCSRVPVTERQFDWIADRYENCLCPVCLDKISTGEVGPIANQERHSDQ